MGKTNGYWNRHPKKELQQVLILFDEQGWRIRKPSTYYKAYCNCQQQHTKTIHLSPSGQNYATDLTKWLRRQTCYSKERSR